MIYALYSNDYEVFLGGNYTSENEVLIKPTEDVLSACDEIGVPMTLFCDLACLWRYRELGKNEFPEAVDKQLVDALGRGHDVQTHIHPHWFETEISQNNEGYSAYNFDLSKFLLGNLVPKGNSTSYDMYVEIFKRAKLYLEQLLQPVNPNYQNIAFRAGGYGIQPHTKQIFKALSDVGYLIDSTIVPGMEYDSNVNRIDFTKVPTLGNYYVSPELGLDAAAGNGLFEIPVLALRPGEANWLLGMAFFRKILRYFGNHSKPKPLGYPIQSTDTSAKQPTLFRQILDELEIVKKGWMMMELSSDVKSMVAATRNYISLYSRTDEDLYFSVSCHSKSTNADILDAFKKYHKCLESIYGDEFKAISYQEAGLELKEIKGSSN